MDATSSIQRTNAAYLAKLKNASKAQAAPESTFPDALVKAQETSKGALAPLPLTGTTEGGGVIARESEKVTSESSFRTAAPLDPTSPEATTYVPHQEDELGFDDLIDLLNPLQHIPIVGTIYRAVTGDEIKPDVQVVGSIAFGLATGSVLLSAASGVASALFEQSTGEEPTVQLAHALFGDETEEPIRVAEAAVAPSSDAPALLAQAMPQTAALDVESVVYTEPSLYAAAKVAASGEGNAPPSQVEDGTLGALFQQQAVAKESGQALPPELVQDMMLKALEKYSAAQTLTSGS